MSILYDGTDEFEIPELCTHATVTCKSIPKEKFKNCLSLETVILEEGVEEIGMDAFEGCAFLERIIFPSTLRKIADNAFFGCGSLERVDLPRGIEEIGTYAFFACHHLEAVRIPEGVKRISKEAFQCCIRLETVILPESLEEIGKQAFMRCEALKNIKLPQNVTKMDEQIFEHCYELEERKNKNSEFKDLSMEDYLKMETPDNAKIERNFKSEAKKLDKLSEFEVKTFENDQMDKMYNIVFTKDWDEYGQDEKAEASPEADAEKEVVVEPTEEKATPKNDSSLQPIVEDVEDEELEALNEAVQKDESAAQVKSNVDTKLEKAPLQRARSELAFDEQADSVTDSEVTTLTKAVEKEDNTVEAGSSIHTNLKTAPLERARSELAFDEQADLVTESDVETRDNPETGRETITTMVQDVRDDEGGHSRFVRAVHTHDEESISSTTLSKSTKTHVGSVSAVERQISETREGISEVQIRQEEKAVQVLAGMSQKKSQFSSTAQIKKEETFSRTTLSKITKTKKIGSRNAGEHPELKSR